MKQLELPFEPKRTLTKDNCDPTAFGDWVADKMLEYYARKVPLKWWQRRKTAAELGPWMHNLMIGLGNIAIHRDRKGYTIK